MRQIVLDTETTGLEPREGHRIIEIGCVELINRRPTDNNFHHYIRPDREVDAGAMEVHGISNEFLADKPPFSELVQEFIDYVAGSELIIHNAPFDVGFLDNELMLVGPEWGRMENHCRVLDTLVMARKLHPGQKNSLDALCKRYGISNEHRQLHGALLDAEILADLYLAMTGGQTALSLDGDQKESGAVEAVRRLPADRPPLRVVQPGDAELAAHAEQLARIDEASGGNCLWKELEP